MGEKKKGGGGCNIMLSVVKKINPINYEAVMNLLFTKSHTEMYASIKSSHCTLFLWLPWSHVRDSDIRRRSGARCHEGAVRESGC